MLRAAAQKERRRISAASKSRELRHAVAQREAAAPWIPNPEEPLAWWGPAEAQAHDEWIATELGDPIPYERLRSNQRLVAGQPVLLTTAGTEHVAYIRLDASLGFIRWVRPGPDWTVCPSELTFNDPLVLWREPYFLKLAKAVTIAMRPTPCAFHAWLRPLVEQHIELQQLHDLAITELGLNVHRPPMPRAHIELPPEPRHAWTATELAGLRIPEGVIERVDLAPGR